MPKTPAAKASDRSEEAILDQAVQQLLRATKAQVEKLSIVTADPDFKKYDVKVVW